MGPPQCSSSAGWGLSKQCRASMGWLIGFSDYKFTTLQIHFSLLNILYKPTFLTTIWSISEIKLSDIVWWGSDVFTVETYRYLLYILVLSAKL